MDIKIAKSGRICRATERTFEHGEEVISLIRSEGQTLVREDYSRDSWDESYAAGALAVWSMHYTDPKVAEQEPPEVFSPLRQVFNDAILSEERLELAIAFLAAQLLRRQKVFRLLKEFDGPEGEARVALYIDRIGDRLIEVRDPSLSYAELETGRVALMDRLSKLEKPEEAVDETALPEASGEDGQE